MLVFRILFKSLWSVGNSLSTERIGKEAKAEIETFQSLIEEEKNLKTLKNFEMIKMWKN